MNCLPIAIPHRSADAGIDELIVPAHGRTGVPCGDSATCKRRNAIERDSRGRFRTFDIAVRRKTSVRELFHA
jgi:hypothetical protein